MSSLLIACADAVVAELNAGTWSQTVTAQRVFIFEPQRKDLEVSDPPLVAVRGYSIEPKRETRGKVQSAIVVEVCVMKGLANVTTASVDPFVALLEEIATHFHSQRLANRTAALVDKAIVDPPYDEKDLSERDQFTGVVRLEITDRT